jgi:quinol monooxygenase YgiN
MLHVIARIETVPGARPKLVEAFRELEPLVRAEAGCLEYVAVVDADTALAAQTRAGDDVLLGVERWAGEAALGAHLDAPHMRAHRARVAPLVARTAVHVLRAAAGTDGR